MNLDKVRRVEEHPTHFVIHHSDKPRPISVAKAGLSPDTVQDIQAFCNGGRVHYDEGTDPAPDPVTSRADLSAISGYLANANKDLGTLSTRPPDLTDLIAQALGGPNLSGKNYFQPLNPTLTVHSALGLPDTTTTALQQDQGLVQAFPGGPLMDATAASMRPTAEPPVTTTTTAPVTQAKPDPTFIGPSNGAGGGVKAPKVDHTGLNTFDQATADQAKGIQDEARNTKGYYRDAETEAKNTAVLADQARTAFQTKMGENTDRQAKLDDAVKTGKLDPNRVWKNSNKGMAALGLILGGIGAALTKGPNYALQVMNDAIDHDLESQKADLEKNRYVSGQNRQDRQQLITEFAHQKADLQDVMASHLQALAMKTGQQTVIDRANQAAAALKAEAMKTRTAISKAEVEAAWDPLLMQSQLQTAATQRAATSQEMKIRGQEAALDITAKKRGLALQDVLRQAMANGDANKVMLAQLMSDPKTAREQAINVVEDAPMQDSKGNPLLDKLTGQPITAPVKRTRYALGNATSADKARDTFSGINNEKLALRDLDGFAKTHPNGTWSPSESQTANVFTNNYILPFLKTEGVNRLNESELNILKEMVENPSNVWGGVSGKTQAGLKALRRVLDLKESEAQKLLIPE
jgi:hypothetical protein